jgi:hypothetical protein
MWAFFVLLLHYVHLLVLRLTDDVLHPLLLQRMIDDYLTDALRLNGHPVGAVIVFVASYLFNWLQCRK